MILCQILMVSVLWVLGMSRECMLIMRSLRGEVGISLNWLVWIRIEFGPLFVRYLWPLVWLQYPPPETWPRVQNPLGLSWEVSPALDVLRLSRSPPQTLVQSPTHRNWYVFYANMDVRYRKCWISHNAATWLHIPARFFFSRFKKTADRLWHSSSKNFLS